MTDVTTDNIHSSLENSDVDVSRYEKKKALLRFLRRVGG